MVLEASLGLRLVPADLADNVEEIGGSSQTATLLLNMVGEVLGQDLDHGLGSKLVHGVVLVVSPGQVAEHVPGQLVDPLDHLGHVGLEVGGGEHVLQLGELLVGDLPLPLQLATALLDHGAQTRVVVHELLEGLGEALGAELADVHGEDDEVEVPLDVVHDLGLEVGLPVVRGDVEGHLGLDDALTDVLNTSSTRGRGSKVNQLVNLGLGNLGLGECSEQLLDDLKLSHLHGVPVLLHGIDTEVQEDRIAMQMGEFEVIKELLAAFPEAKVAKAQVDKLIDLAAPPPRGTGVENIRECIIESKMTFDVSSDDWQTYLKNKIMNNIERYFYLIVFAMYIREVGPKGFLQTFKQFMDENSGLRTMIEEGRGKLEWERKIPDEKLAELKDMLSTAEFKANMPKVIKRIYELSWDMFGDLPRGHHKNNSMHKLASKTMIEILPENLANHVEKKCGSLAGTPDFFDVIGQVSWYEPEA